MSSTIKPKLGTTAQWQASGRVLEMNEWGVEKTVKGSHILRIGDGEHLFHALPAVFDADTFEDAMAQVAATTATANAATQTATEAAARATEAAETITSRIAQTTGDSETLVMSQKAVTRIADAIFRPCDATWEVGGLTGASGATNTQTSRVRTNFLYARDLAVAYLPNTQYQFALFLYDEVQKYIGSSELAAFTNEVNLDEVLAQYPACKYVRFSIRKTNDGVMDIATDVDASGMYIARLDTKRAWVAVDAMHEKLAIVPVKFIHGTLLSDTGSIGSPSSRRCITDKMPYDAALTVLLDSEYECYLYFYDGGTYLGNTGGWLSESAALSAYAELGADTFRIVVRRAGDGEMTTEEVDEMTHHVTLYQQSSAIVKVSEHLNAPVKKEVEMLGKTANDMYEKLAVMSTNFVRGSISSAMNGMFAAATNRCVSNTMPYQADLHVQIDKGYYAYLHFYSAGTYLGNTGGWLSESAALSAYAELGADTFRIVVRRADDGEMTTEEVDEMTHHVTLYQQSSVVVKMLEANSAPLHKFRERWGIYETNYQLGAISSQYGTVIASSTRCYSKLPYLDTTVIRAEEGVLVYLHFYDGDTYVGNSGGWLGGVVFLSAYAQLGATVCKIVARTETDTVFTAETVSWFDDKVVAFSTDKMFAKVALTQQNTYDYAQTGLPILELFGDTSLMTKDNAVTLEYKYGNRTGTCTCKWQGSSSVRRGYPKRNYTIKFDNTFEAKKGWGEQNKYCMKANWVDPSATRNVVNARLWGQVVASRTNAVTDGRASAPNYGAIDGFPVLIEINGAYEGLYTFNIPKDAWMMAMGEGNAEYMVVSESNGVPACLFKGLAVCDETDYSIEYKPDGVEDDMVIASFNTLLQATMDAGADWETTLAPYLDIDSVIDYFIFVNCINGHDNLGKNIVYGTYDGVKWFMSAYDLDTTYGSNPYGQSTVEWPIAWYQVVNTRNQFKEAANMHRLAHLVYKYSKARLKARYQELRGSVLSDENIWYTMTNFVNDIPRSVYNADAERWPTMPATATANISTYLDFYRMHCAYLDKEIAAFSVE